MTDWLATARNAPAARRRRIERQLRALHAMQRRVGMRDIVLAVLSIVGVAFLVLLAAAKTHVVAGSWPLTVGSAALAGGMVWWLGRRWFALALLLVYALLMIVTEGSAPVGDFSRGSRHVDRRAKLERAIAKREALLRTLAEGEI